MDMKTAIILCLTAVAAFLLSALPGRWLIPWLHKLHFGQTILDIGPSWHKKKQGTPTMGGLLFIIGTVAAALIAGVACELLPETLVPQTVLGGTQLTNTRLFAGLLMALGCAMIGFADDYIKVVKKRNLGLTARQKLMAQLMVATAYALSLYLAKDGSVVDVPFIGSVDFGLWFLPFCIFVVIAMTNATNLTDGVDGLCSTVSLIVTLLFMTLSALTGFFGQSLLAAAFAGGLGGFLVWNWHPAKTFMGDVGSLFIGGLLCCFAFGIGQPFLLLPAGILYIAENLSVILQVGYFKLTHGKRLFKMSPLHHHFEMCGWSEKKIVTVFSLVTAAGCALATWIALR